MGNFVRIGKSNWIGGHSKMRILERVLINKLLVLISQLLSWFIGLP